MANVDEVLGEMFLEEVQPTEEQLIVSTLFIDTVNDCTMYSMVALKSVGTLARQNLVLVQIVCCEISPKYLF